ncbi:hypothetical protein F0562_018584 [Nyssa sinensis]|uniref:Uncharacterized protein n=1 Tax=Nyssa sinensis TaxID=561372 RepID=A0A5J4ZB44_9ASTE|nr:hypothetical protein F0562_018584 [Nyssa sinensis]
MYTHTTCKSNLESGNYFVLFFEIMVQKFRSELQQNKQESRITRINWNILSGNPANDLVDIINKNRTAKRISQLSNSPGLGCMALQYVEECKGNCTTNNTVNCQPPEDDFTEVFAPNCGVELPTFGTISGLIVGCQHKYLEPSEAFSHVLVQDKKTLSLLGNKTHTEVGVGLIGTHKGPYFWCVLFSSSQKNTTFVLEDLGKGIKQKKGCYSGNSIPCSGGQKTTSHDE